MLRLAHTRLPHALTSVKGRRRCPDLALLRRRALGVCRERRARAPSRPTPRGQLCRPPHGRPHTRMGTQERFTAPDRGTASTQVYMYLTTLAHPHMGLLRVPPRVAVSVRTDLASAAHSAPSAERC